MPAAVSWRRLLPGAEGVAEGPHLFVDGEQLRRLGLEQLRLAAALAVQLEDQRAQVEQQRLADLGLTAQAPPHATALKCPWPVGVSAPQAHDGATIAAPSAPSQAPSRGLAHHPPQLFPAPVQGECGEDPFSRPPPSFGAQLERSPHAVGHLAGVLGGDEHARIAHHLGHGGHVQHHRHAAGEHRLGHRQPEALVARGLHVDRGAPVPREQVLVGGKAGQLHVGGGPIAQPARRRRPATCPPARSGRRAAPLAASTNGIWPFWTSVPSSIAPTLRATRSPAGGLAERVRHTVVDHGDLRRVQRRVARRSPRSE